MHYDPSQYTVSDEFHEAPGNQITITIRTRFPEGQWAYNQELAFKNAQFHMCVRFRFTLAWATLI